MAVRKFGLIMHGVTGRMGLNQHLVRSIVAIRDAGRRRARQRRPADARSDPGRTQCGEGRGAGRASTASPAGATTSTRRWPIPTTRSSSTPARRRCGPSCSRGRSTPASISIARSRSRTCWSRRSRSRGRRATPASRTASSRTSCSCPGCASSRCCGTPASSAACSRSGASSATGSSRATGSRRSGRRWNYRKRRGRRHHPRYALPLALRARQPVRRGARGLAASGATHIPNAPTRPGGIPAPTPMTRPMRRSSSRAA